MLVAEWDYDLDMEVARDEGREEGREEGRDEERHKNIQGLYRIGVSIETIAKAVDLSERQVKDILGL